jgi:hypothetical protein
MLVYVYAKKHTIDCLRNSDRSCTESERLLQFYNYMSRMINSYIKEQNSPIFLQTICIELKYVPVYI